jgi:hypothetical protein
MSQSDYTIADQDGASFLVDINAQLAAIVSNNSGATEPATKYAYQWWADTSSGILKQRNAANSAWVNILTLSSGEVSAIPNDIVTTAKILAANVTNAKLAADVFSTAHTWSAAQSFTANTLVTASALLGYGTGAGGTVTQATSKSTAVTLNKPTGEITMNNTALLSNTSVVFVVNNTLFNPADTVILTLKGGVSSFASYLFNSASQGVGQFVIHLRNISAGSLSESVVISYSIIKGATS